MINAKIHVKIIAIMGNVANKWSQQQLKTSSRSIGCPFKVTRSYRQILELLSVNVHNHVHLKFVYEI